MVVHHLHVPFVNGLANRKQKCRVVISFRVNRLPFTQKPLSTEREKDQFNLILFPGWTWKKADGNYIFWTTFHGVPFIFENFPDGWYKIVLAHLQSNRNFRNSRVNGKQPYCQSEQVCTQAAENTFFISWQDRLYA